MGIWIFIQSQKNKLKGNVLFLHAKKSLSFAQLTSSILFLYTTTTFIVACNLQDQQQINLFKTCSKLAKNWKVKMQR